MALRSEQCYSIQYLCVLFRFYFFLFFGSLEMSLFPSIFVPFPFSLCLESTPYVFSLRIVFLKKNQTTPRPSEHPLVMGGEMSKRLGGIKRLQIQNLFMALKQVPRCR